MSTIKTTVNDASVENFINNVKSETKRRDGLSLLEIFKKVTGEEPKMWGSSIVGFGTYRYESAKTGRGGEWMTVGFSPREAALTLYGLIHYEEGRESLTALGKVKTGKGCIYINNLSDINLEVLKKMIKISFDEKNGKSLKLGTS